MSEQVLKNLIYIAELIKILGDIEAKIDFLEEDIPESVSENIKAKCYQLNRNKSNFR